MIKSVIQLTLALGLSGWAAVDLGTYKGCAASDADFKMTQIFTGPTVTTDDSSNGALKLAFATQTDGTTDVYFIQKQGAVKRFNGKAATIDSLGVIPVDHYHEQGLIGIAIPDDFLKSQTIYFNYSAKEPGGTYSFHVSRIKLAAGGKSLDMASEKIILNITRKEVTWHTGGDMVFDAYGDLWIAIGDNQTTELGPANTSDLRGGILRIHPDDSPKGYSIPAGNFGPHLSAFFKAQNNTDLANQYADTAKVKPEIYVKGTRNAYTISLDPVRRWLTWGDVGPDQQRVSEEHNLVKEPFYMGWPYFAGEEDMGGITPYDTPVPTGSLRSGPINNFAMNGVKQLPPIREPIFARNEGCSMTGPIFRYDGSLKTANQFPPQFDHKWMISGCDGYGFHLITLDSTGEKVASNLQIFTSIHPNTLVDLKQGPDGALYFVAWGSGVYRIDYQGACKDPALLPEKTGCATPGYANYDPKLPKEFNDPRLCANGTAVAAPILDANWLRVDARSISIDAAGPHSVAVLDIRGRVMAEMNGEGPMSHGLPALPAPALYQVRVRTSLGTAVKSLSLVGL